MDWRQNAFECARTSFRLCTIITRIILSKPLRTNIFGVIDRASNSIPAQYYCGGNELNQSPPRFRERAQARTGQAFNIRRNRRGPREFKGSPYSGGRVVCRSHGVPGRKKKLDFACTTIVWHLLVVATLQSRLAIANRNTCMHICCHLAGDAALFFQYSS